jgi:hypothetical protein
MKVTTTWNGCHHRLVAENRHDHNTGSSKSRGLHLETRKPGCNEVGPWPLQHSSRQRSFSSRHLRMGWFLSCSYGAQLRLPAGFKAHRLGQVRRSAVCHQPSRNATGSVDGSSSRGEAWSNYTNEQHVSSALISIEHTSTYEEQ